MELPTSLNFSDNLRFLIDVLQQNKLAGIPVFFVSRLLLSAFLSVHKGAELATSIPSAPLLWQILDEFHIFAQRSKQTLLYNLSDLLQSGNAQIAIVGLTTRLDAYELLEKRIRSRISYRYLFSAAYDIRESVSLS